MPRQPFHKTGFQHPVITKLWQNIKDEDKKMTSTKLDKLTKSYIQEKSEEQRQKSLIYYRINLENKLQEIIDEYGFDMIDLLIHKYLFNKEDLQSSSIPGMLRYISKNAQKAAYDYEHMIKLFQDR